MSHEKGFSFVSVGKRLIQCTSQRQIPIWDVFQGYSTCAEMALEMLQTRKRPAAIFARQGLPVGGSGLLSHFPRGSSLVLHSELPWNWSICPLMDNLRAGKKNCGVAMRGFCEGGHVAAADVGLVLSDHQSPKVTITFLNCLESH